MVYRYIFLLFISIIGSNLIGQEYYGVYFKSKEVSKESRTGIDVTKKGLIAYENSFSISFDLSYRSTSHRYGHLFQMKDFVGNNNLDVIFQFDHIILVHNKKTPLIKVFIPEKYHNLYNYWHKINITYAGSKNEIELSFDQFYERAKLSLPKQSEYALTFGVVDNYGFEPVEVPPITIKEIKISSNNKLQFHWPLKQNSGNYEKDLVNKKEIGIVNPDWELNHHNQWKKQATLSFESEIVPQIAFDSISEIFYFLTSNSKIIKHHLNSGKLETVNYYGTPLFEEAQQLIVDKNGELSSYSFNKPGISHLKKESNTWSYSKPFMVEFPHYWHHNKLFHPITDQLVVLNGYGFYLYKNSIQTFNTQSQYWENMNFTGDTIHPRYLSSLGSGDDRNTYYLFGGLGNRSGKQILGLEFYYDLYSIDFSTYKIKKLWDLDQSPLIYNYTPVNSMIIDEKNNCFYTLFFPHEQYNTHLRVVKSSLNEPNFEWIGDSIPYLFKDIESFADLYYWKSRNSLIAITLHKKDDKNFEADIFTLKFPPIDSSILSTKKTSLFSHSIIFLIAIGVFLIVIIGLLLTMLKNKKLNRKYKSQKTELSNTDDIESIVSYKNSIYLFGGFQVFDKNGKDITYRFSPTLKELFLLILLNTRKKGISSMKIQEFLWPDKDEDKAKNNRGVNIKKLRELIEDIDGVEIDFDNTYWKLTLKENVFCDYFYIMDLIENYNYANEKVHKNVRQIIKLLSKGNFLNNTSAEWLDNFKGKVSHNIVEYLESQVIIFCKLKEYSFTIETANIIFIFDQINEIALKNKVKALSAQGHHSLSLDTYNRFCLLYNELYNEEYSVPLKKIVK